MDGNIVPSLRNETVTLDGDNFHLQYFPTIILEIRMRSIIAIATIATIAVLSACASKTPVPEKAAVVPSQAPVAAAVAAEKVVPKCYSGDAGKFFSVGDKTNIAGIDVECKPNSDGKSGQWMAVKR